jgi:hypothetical protein
MRPRGSLLRPSSPSKPKPPLACGQLVIGLTYAAAEWDCGGEYNCYVVAGHVPGERITLDYELQP